MGFPRRSSVWLRVLEGKHFRLAADLDLVLEIPRSPRCRENFRCLGTLPTAPASPRPSSRPSQGIDSVSLASQLGLSVLRFMNTYTVCDMGSLRPIDVESNVLCVPEPARVVSQLERACSESVHGIVAFL